MNEADILKFIPPSLYNFMAVVIGGVADYDLPHDDSHYVHLMPSIKCKVLSICQDIVYAQSKGTALTPKSAALGVAVRHLTGSRHISRLLSGLGHACSYDTIMRIETALAVQQLNSSKDIPANFTEKKITVMVYDNIDFCEETLSGAGSTHHTNGIRFRIGATSNQLHYSQL